MCNSMQLTMLSKVLHVVLHGCPKWVAGWLGQLLCFHPNVYVEDAITFPKIVYGFVCF